jgi:hypothetical protein
MKLLRHVAVLALSTPVGATLAANHIVDIQWSNDGRFQHQAQVAAGKFVEICGKLSSGNVIRWSFDGSAPMDFNIHYHVGKDVVFPAKVSQVATGQDTLAVTVPQDYCWMWANKGTTPVNLKVELRR